MIDIHTHFVPEHLPALAASASEPTWPSMCPGRDCRHRHVMVKGDVYRVVSDQCWSAPQRISDMAGMGVVQQVISPMPELLSYWMDATNAAVLHRDINEQMARLVADHPGQFRALAAVPLQDVDVAIVELEYAHHVLGLAGVEIGSNVNGRPIGAPEFRTFFEAAQRMDMAVFVHALRPPGKDRLLGPPALEQVLGFPTEIGLSAASVITTDLIAHLPDLKLAFSHGGGSLAMLLPRLQHAWSSVAAVGAAIEMSPVDQVRRLYFDCLVYDKDTLEFLLRRFGTEGLMIGTDYPFGIMERDPLGRLHALSVDEGTQLKLSHLNAERFLFGTPRKKAGT